MCWQAATRHPP
ncbi:hypothetical protein YPPY64_1463, partial [Yersinia pestis PY-64]